MITHRFRRKSEDALIVLPCYFNKDEFAIALDILSMKTWRFNSKLSASLLYCVSSHSTYWQDTE